MRRERIVSVRFSEQELREVARLAEHTGVSTWLRALAIAEIARQREASQRYRKLPVRWSMKPDTSGPEVTVRPTGFNHR
jgi:hypothetical protein